MQSRPVKAPQSQRLPFSCETSSQETRMLLRSAKRCPQAKPRLRPPFSCEIFFQEMETLLLQAKRWLREKPPLQLLFSYAIFWRAKQTLQRPQLRRSFPAKQLDWPPLSCAIYV